MQIIGGTPQGIIPIVQRAHVAVEPIPGSLETSQCLAGIPVGRGKVPSRECIPELADDLALVRLVAVGIQAELGEADLREALVNNVERRHLLTDEQYALVRNKALGD